MALEVKKNPDPPIIADPSIELDVYGRRYDPEVPVFMPTGTNFVYDRLKFGPKSLVDVDSLIQKALRLGWEWGTNEIGEPPAWWLDVNTPPVPIVPGYGTGTDPNAPYAPFNRIAPKITSSDSEIGQVLTCDGGDWMANPTLNIPVQINRDPQFDDENMWTITSQWEVADGKATVTDSTAVRSLSDPTTVTTLGETYKFEMLVTQVTGSGSWRYRNGGNVSVISGQTSTGIG